MPRKDRKKSKCGIYHIMITGINRQTIFEDEEDNGSIVKPYSNIRRKEAIKYM